jgi:hypothetical protein
MVMPITKVVPDGQGGAWGWDTDANDWVPVDQEAMQGSFAGNLMRGAGRGFEGVGLGIEGLINPNEANEAQTEAYQQRTTEAERAAPWGETLGQAAPDIAAGGIATALTGGASLPFQIAAQAAAGGATAFARPGGLEERLGNAAWGAGLATAAGVLGPAAVKGIGAALEIGRGITTKAGATVADSIEAGSMRVANAERRAAQQAAMEADQMAAGQPGSVGAAATPEGQLDPAIVAEGAAMDLDEAGGLVTGEMTAGQRRIADDAAALGYKVPASFGAARGSAQKILQAGREYLPGAAEGEQARIGLNNQLKNRAFAKAAGFTDRLDDGRYNAIDPDMMARWETRLNKQYEEVGNELPGIERIKVNKVFDKIDDSEAPLLGGERWNRVKSGLMQTVAAAPDKAIRGKEFMRTTQAIGREMSEAFKEGDQFSGEMLLQLQNQLFDLAERETPKAPSRFGRHGKDPSITGKGWTRLRQEANLFRVANMPGAIGPDGTINTRSLMNRLKAAKKNGGWGNEGPPDDSPLRDLWTILQADNLSESAVPATGARLAMQMMARNAIGMAPGGALATAGLAGINSLWNR